MQAQGKRVLAVIGAAALLTALSSVPSSVLAQGQAAYRAPRAADGHPDLNGIWQALSTANWNLESSSPEIADHHEYVGVYLASPPTLSVVEGGKIPYKPEALAKRKEYKENRLKPNIKLVLDNSGTGFDNSDPEAKCFQGGVPRASYMPHPFHLVQTPSAVLMAYQFGGASRLIHMDKKRTDLLEIQAWMGQSVGQWQGETLVVDTRWFDSNVWLDRAGNYYTSTAVVTERFTPMSPNHLMYEVTIEDPTVYTRPWKMSMPLYRRLEQNAEVLEFQCIPFAEEFMYGPLIRKHTVEGLQRGRDNQK